MDQQSDEYDVPSLEDEEEDAWFGEGSAFDSGEDLAAALMAMGTDAADEEPAQTGAVAGPAPSTAPGARGAPRVLPHIDSGTGPGWGVREQGLTGIAGQANRSRWGMRSSVLMLKTTEDVITRLQKDALDVVFHAAAIACAQRSRRPKR